MGNGQSLSAYNPSHVRIYRNLLQIKDPRTRAEMIRTLMAGQEYIATARAAGVYSHLLSYVARVGGGERPQPLPGEVAMTAVVQGGGGPPQPREHQVVEYGVNAIRPVVQQRPQQAVVKARRNEKALNYFQSCLQVLGLEEEVALTESALKKAYKIAALKAHPDKGGSEEDFEAVTRANAYLGEILRRIHGGRATEGKVEAPETLKGGRTEEAKKWEMVEPVRLNPKKLDLNAFNQMFEQTRIPDPDDDGYGDWLKSESGANTGPKFGGKFNRDVFNQAFEEEAKKRVGGRSGNEVALRQPEALTLGAMGGVELGRERPETYTAAANASMKFTDLRSAYTSENTITNQVADVHVEARSFDQYSAQWKQAPKPLADHEMEAVQAAEAAAARREKQRQIRAAEELSMSDQYFQRMKQLVITNGAAAQPAIPDKASVMRRLTNN